MQVWLLAGVLLPAAILGLVRRRRPKDAGIINTPAPADPVKSMPIPHLETNLPAQKEEEPGMGASLSSEEMAALLGHNQRSAYLADLRPIANAAQAAIQALRDHTAIATEWTTANACVVSGPSFCNALGLPPGAVLLVSEAHVPGGSVFVAASTLTVCRLDEAVRPLPAAREGEVLFAGWRRLVDNMLTRFCQDITNRNVIDTQSAEVCPNATLPRRFDTTMGLAGLGLLETSDLVVCRLRAPADSTMEIYLMAPDSTIAVFLDTPAVAAGGEAAAGSEPAELATTADTHTASAPEAQRPVAAEPCINEHSSLDERASLEDEHASWSNVLAEIVGDIKLDVSINCALEPQPVHTLASWSPGMRFALQTGKDVQLLVHGRAFARSRLVADADGALFLEITALMPDAVDAG